MLAEPDEYGVNVSTINHGAVIIDAGIEGKGGYLAGEAVTEICLGGYGKAEIDVRPYGSMTLPSIQVYTDHPVVATLGSQYAGWRIKVGDYAKIEYRDSSDCAVIVLEASQLPSEEVGEYIADTCGVRSDGLYILVAPTTSIVGSIQVSGRIVETGLHKLVEMGFDPRKIRAGLGVAPITPVHPTLTGAMGRTNDMILYGGVVYLEVEADDDEQLKKLVDAAPSSASKDYGRPFAEIFEAAGHDFYEIDPALFAPAIVMVNNVKTGSFFRAGRIDANLIAKSLSQ
jgi:methenyltetrahydromethanopterin cyclohydrolase